MRAVYINGLGSVSAQRTFDSDFLEFALVNNTDSLLPIVAPAYKDFISPIASRRMASGVKNSIVASSLAMQEALNPTIEAIIVGTGTGCINDSETFLKAILDNNEEYLTPISFIQSIQNTVATQIALGLKCKGYNYTYVNNAVSFESSLMDGKMMLNEREATSILVGGVDETAKYTTFLLKLSGLLKEDSDLPCSILNSTTKGVVYGSGATFFVLEEQPKESCYAKLVDVTILNSATFTEVEDALKLFLHQNNVHISDLDAVVLGYNGDVEADGYYSNLTQNLLAQTPQIYYKHLCGEFNTASAFGFWIGCKVIKNQAIPEIIQANNLVKERYKTILLYNQYRGANHSFTLLASC